MNRCDSYCGFCSDCRFRLRSDVIIAVAYILTTDLFYSSFSFGIRCDACYRMFSSSEFRCDWFSASLPQTFLHSLCVSCSELFKIMCNLAGRQRYQNTSFKAFPSGYILLQLPWCIIQFNQERSIVYTLWNMPSEIQSPTFLCNSKTFWY